MMASAIPLPTFFKNCESLKEVVCMSATPTEITDLDIINSYPTSKATEFNISDNVAECILKVPAGSEALYAAHPIWGKFKTIYGFSNGDYTSINTINSENTPTSSAVYYNLQGLKINTPAKGELYILITGNKAEKMVF